MSKIKVGELVEQVLRKSGKYTSDLKEIVQEIKNLDKEIDEDAAQEIIDSLIPSAEILSHQAVVDKLESGKKAAKAEVLDGIDKGVLSLRVASLTDEQKQEYNSLKNTIERTKFLFKALEAKDDKTAQRQIEQMQKEIERVQSEIEEKYVAKDQYDQVSTKAQKLSQKLIEESIISSAKTNPNLIDTSNNRFFRKNFVEDFNNSYLASKKLTIDPETGYLLDHEGNQYLEKGKPILLENAVSKFIDETPDWKKKSDPVNVTPVSVQTQVDNFKDVSIANQRNLKRSKTLLEQ